MTAQTLSPELATLGEDALADASFTWAFHDTRTPAQRLAEARRLFTDKFGVEPSYCLCNDQTAAAIGADFEGITVLGRPFIREYELRLGAPGGSR